MTLRPIIVAASGIVLLSACRAVPAPAPPTPGVACAIIGSSDWNAWLSAMPGPNMQPVLIVTGKVTVPTGGYTFAWRNFRVMESYPVQLVGELEAIPPIGGATQAVVTHEVRGEWPISPPVGSFTVRCGDMVLARISPVEAAR